MALRGVGFKLPVGAVSDAYNITPLKQRINQAVDLYGPDGDTPLPNFNELVQQRYGRVEQNQPGVVQLPDVQGDHSPSNYADLETVWNGNRAWFGTDSALYDGVPTQQEVEDAHYTQVSGAGRQLFREALRLRLEEAGGNTPPPPPIEPPPPPPPPVDPPPPPPTRQLSPASKQTLVDMVTWSGKVIGVNRLARLKALKADVEGLLG